MASGVSNATATTQTAASGGAAQGSDSSFANALAKLKFLDFVKAAKDPSTKFDDINKFFSSAVSVLSLKKSDPVYLLLANLHDLAAGIVSSKQDFTDAQKNAFLDRISTMVDAAIMNAAGSAVTTSTGASTTPPDPNTKANEVSSEIFKYLNQHHTFFTAGRLDLMRGLDAMLLPILNSKLPAALQDDMLAAIQTMASQLAAIMDGGQKGGTGGVTSGAIWSYSYSAANQAEIHLGSRYTLKMATGYDQRNDPNSGFVIYDNTTGNKTHIFRDGTVDTNNDGKADITITKDMTFKLEDGTKISMTSIPVDYSAAPTTLVITNGDNAMEVDGLAGWTQDINLQISMQNGRAKQLAAMHDEGSITLTASGNRWTTSDGKTVQQSDIFGAEARYQDKFTKTVTGSISGKNLDGNQYDWTYLSNAQTQLGKIDLGNNYYIWLNRSDDNNPEIIVMNKLTGKSMKISGNANVDLDNNGSANFVIKNTMTFQLADGSKPENGTKITVTVEPAWKGDGMRVSKLFITNGDNAIEVDGMAGWRNDRPLQILAHSESDFGKYFDAMHDDGGAYIQQVGNGWQTAGGNTVTQDFITASEFLYQKSGNLK